MPLSVYFKNPLTDLSGQILNSQLSSPCGNMEMRAVNCMEAYGEEGAQTKCKLLLEDLYECITRKKEMMRVIEMKAERERQIRNGERAVHYAEGPAHDSYQSPT